MTIDEWLKHATEQLQAAEIDTARLDAFILLEYCLEQNRAWLLAHAESKLSANHLSKLTKLLNRRLHHEPIAYIRGYSEFYGRQFVLTSAVLQPRPESEVFIDLLKRVISENTSLQKRGYRPRIADLGAGCGALGITARLEIPNSIVTLFEIDKSAAKIAKINVDKFTLNISIVISDLLEASEESFDVLLCNLPYVPDDYRLNKAATFEPKLAIFGGSDGLSLYRRLFHQVYSQPHKPLFILCESFPAQHQKLREIGRQAGYTLLKSHDFIQVFQAI